MLRALPRLPQDDPDRQRSFLLLAGEDAGVVREVGRGEEEEKGREAADAGAAALDELLVILYLLSGSRIAICKRVG